jgi:type VI secretion system protein ImpE
MSHIDEATAALKAADTSGCLNALQAAVRSAPADAKLRNFLFQLLCIRGEWDRATTQLNVAAEMDAAAIAMKQVYGDPIACERLRSAVFAGKKAPMVFGMPEEWLALLIEALFADAAGDTARAQHLRGQAFENAPASSGTVDEKPFEWFADADSRIGPVLEAIINNRYYWVPFNNLLQLDIEPPEDLRDSVWMPAHLMFTNGGETLALIPTRYVGSEQSENGAIQLARETHWREVSEGVAHGLGQRVFATDIDDFALMDIRCVKFNSVPVEGGSEELSADELGEADRG